jgi:hypothetical protein
MKHIQRVPFKPPTFQSIIVEKLKAFHLLQFFFYMKFVAYERGTQRILFCNLEVAALAVMWHYSHEKENATPQQ